MEPPAEIPSGCVRKCQACPHRELSYALSLQQKRAWLSRALARWDTVISPIQSQSPESRWHYRSKVCLRARWQEGRWEFGMLVRIRGTREYEFVPIPECPIHTPKVREVLRFLSTGLPSPSILQLAFVSIAGSLLTLVIKDRTRSPSASWSFPDSQMAALQSMGITGVFLNWNPSAGQRVFSVRGWQRAGGEPCAELACGTMKLKYGPASFQQVSEALYLAALQEARGFLKPGVGGSVIDLCSGIGASLVGWRDSGARTIGVELVGEAARYAELNAGEGTCLQGRASERLPQLEAWLCRSSGRKVLFANPPRTGLEPEVTRWMGAMFRPERIAYLSCSAGTLARDLELLAEAGYVVKMIIPYDFFPNTLHVEALACLELG